MGWDCVDRRHHLIPQFSTVFHLIRFFRRQLMLTQKSGPWGMMGPWNRPVLDAHCCALAPSAALLAALAWAVAGPRRRRRRPFEDTIAQRAMACTACHGRKGRAAPDGYYPRLAGKPAGYLYNQLLNFRDGRRHYGLMTQLIAPLSDAYLMEIASIFRSWKCPTRPRCPPPPRPRCCATAGSWCCEGDAARQLPACVQCHGQAMTGVAPGIPGLLGLPRDYLNAQLGAWKAGTRRAHAPDCMKEVVARLTLEDINAVASWAGRAAPARQHQAGHQPAALAAGATAITCGSAPTVPWVNSRTGEGPK
jgi:cytochrome c553